MNMQSQNSTQCAAITLLGHQCSRKRRPNSEYCWQHQNYVTRMVTVQQQVKPEPRRATILASIAPEPIQMAQVEVPIIRTGAITGVQPVNRRQTGKVYQFPRDVIEVDLPLDEQKLSSAYDQIGAVGPFTLVVPVGQYDSTMIDFDLDFAVGNYTFTDILEDILDLYSRSTTLEEIDHLLKVAKRNRDQLSEGLYTQYRMQIKRGDDIPLFGLNGTKVRFDKIVYDDKVDKFYLLLKNI
jgi:hypothetical protein